MRDHRQEFCDWAMRWGNLQDLQNFRAVWQDLEVDCEEMYCGEWECDCIPWAKVNDEYSGGLQVVGECEMIINTIDHGGGGDEHYIQLGLGDVFTECEGYAVRVEVIDSSWESGSFSQCALWRWDDTRMNYTWYPADPNNSILYTVIACSWMFRAPTAGWIRLKFFEIYCPE